MAENALTQTAVVGASPHPQVLRGVVEAGARCRAARRAAIWEEEQKGFAGRPGWNGTASPINVVHLLSLCLNKAGLQDISLPLPGRKSVWVVLVSFLIWSFFFFFLSNL